MEVWKTINNFDNYEISSYGRIRSIDRTIIRSNGRPLVLKGKLLIPDKNSKGYLMLRLRSNNGKFKKVQIHRLVAITFIPNPDNLPQVNHIDENKTNNYVDNLEWCTVKYNANYGNRNKNISKALTNNYKISRVILQFDKDGNLIKEWISIHQIYRELGYSPGNIYSCCQKKYKQSYGYIWRYKEELN